MLSAADIERANQLQTYLVNWSRTWAFKHLIRLPHDVIALFTGNQCNFRSSKIYDPVKNTYTRIDEMGGDFHVLAWDGKKLVVAQAQKPYTKPAGKHYRFELSNGKSFIATMGHRVLTPTGYKRLSSLRVGSLISNPEGQCRYFGDNGAVNVPISSSGQDFQAGCREYSCFCDEQPRSGLNSDQGVLPLQGDVPVRKEQDFSHEGGRECKPRRIHDRLQPCRRANQDARSPLLAPGVGFLYRVFCIGRSRIYDLCQACLRLASALNRRFRQVCGFFRLANEILCYVFGNFFLRYRMIPQVVAQPIYGAFFQPRSNGGLYRVARQSVSCEPPLHDLRITKVTYYETDVKWDFGVPGYHNYYHEGVIHHNSMKTSSVAYQYVMRIFGHHPVPKKNIMYLECESRSIDDIAPHGYYERRDIQTGAILRGWEKGTWSIPRPNSKKNPFTLPESGICPFCGGKIVMHYKNSRIFRFAAENLPTEKEDTGGQSKEINNSVYPEFKKWLPDFLIKRDGSGKKMDITIRKPSITILDPNSGARFFAHDDGLKIDYVGNDVVVEFVSYNQQTQSGAGVQRASVWLDEHGPFDFFDEQQSRGFADDADTILTLTPAMGFGWEYDYIFEEADTFIRTQAVADYLSSLSSKAVPLIERTGSDKDIAVIQAATDDNPTFSAEVVERKYKNRPDPDGTVIPMRRYGIFKQASGRVYKSMNFKIHVIEPKKFGLTPQYLSTCTLGRAMDYHERVPHHIVWAAITENDECFVYKELLASVDKYVIKKLCRKISEMSADDRFSLNLIDALANKINTETGRTTIEEMNKYFHALKKEGVGTGGYWSPWNTKGDVGRDEIKTRLENSVRVGRPLNNFVVEEGIKKRLPTIWFFNNCHEVARHIKHWRFEEWKDNRQLVSKERKETFEQKHSHFCTALEALFKDRRFRAKRNKKPGRHRAPDYFKGTG